MLTRVRVWLYTSKLLSRQRDIYLCWSHRRHAVERLIFFVLFVWSLSLFFFFVNRWKRIVRTQCWAFSFSPSLSLSCSLHSIGIQLLGLPNIFAVSSCTSALCYGMSGKRIATTGCFFLFFPLLSMALQYIRSSRYISVYTPSACAKFRPC